MGRVPGRFHREHESGRGLVAPFRETLRLLRAVESPIDLDRGEPAGGVLQLALVREVGGIESAPPRLIGPPPDPHPDLAAHLNSPISDAPAEICSFAP